MGEAPERRCAARPGLFVCLGEMEIMFYCRTWKNSVLVGLRRENWGSSPTVGDRKRPKGRTE